MRGRIESKDVMGWQLVEGKRGTASPTSSPYIAQHSTYIQMNQGKHSVDALPQYEAAGAK